MAACRNDRHENFRRFTLSWSGLAPEFTPFPSPQGWENGRASTLAELPTSIVVGTSLSETEKAQPLSEFLLEVAINPTMGPARLPGKIRVADEAAAADLQSIAGLPVKITVAPTPEIDEIVDDLRRTIDASSQEEDYLSGGTIDFEAVGALFRAAAVLYTLAPWKTGPQPTRSPARIVCARRSRKRAGPWSGNRFGKPPIPEAPSRIPAGAGQRVPPPQTYRKR